jgi:hypothetical protein
MNIGISVSGLMAAARAGQQDYQWQPRDTPAYGNPGPPAVLANRAAESLTCSWLSSAFRRGGDRGRGHAARSTLIDDKSLLWILYWTDDLFQGPGVPRYRCHSHVRPRFLVESGTEMPLE